MVSRSEVLENWESIEDVLKDEYALVEEKDDVLNNCKKLLSGLHLSLCREQGISPSESAKEYNVEV